VTAARDAQQFAMGRERSVTDPHTGRMNVGRADTLPAVTRPRQG